MQDQPLRALVTNQLTAMAACAQDVAIAYGYNNLAWTVPQTVTTGAELPLNALSEALRAEAAMAGYTEILTWALTSRAENFGHLRRPDQAAGAVSVGNPATVEFEVCRTTLLSGALPACRCPFACLPFARKACITGAAGLLLWC
jgi:phenylalanyl-tRNA synthetase beta subunit